MATDGLGHTRLPEKQGSDLFLAILYGLGFGRKLGANKAD